MNIEWPPPWDTYLSHYTDGEIIVSPEVQLIRTGDSINVADFQDERSTIIRELAERGPIIVGDGQWCATCPEGDPQRPPYPTDKIEDHASSCLWRRSREMYPKVVSDG